MDSGLYNAVITDNVDALREIEGRLNVGNQRTPTNNTVLHLACQYGSIRCVEEIISVHGSLLLEMNAKGETALHGAAREGHYDVAVLLINAATYFVPQPTNMQTATPSTVERKNLTENTDVDAVVNEPLTEEKEQQALQSASTENIMSDQPSLDVGGPSSTPNYLTILIRSTDSQNETALHWLYDTIARTWLNC